MVAREVKSCSGADDKESGHILPGIGDDAGRTIQHSIARPAIRDFSRETRHAETGGKFRTDPDQSACH